MNKRGVVRTLLASMAAMLLSGSMLASTTAVTISGGEQHASNGNWDSGSLTLTVDGHTETVIFGQFSSVQSVASGLAAKFSQDCNSPVKAHANGAVITFQTNLLEVSFAQVSASPVWDTSDFAQSSFNILQPQGSPGAPTPSLALSCTPNPVPAGGSADCTAVLPEGVSGTVNFDLTGQPQWSTAQVDSNGYAPASTLSNLSAGQYTVTASYTGNTSYSTVSQSLTLTVDNGSLASTGVYWYTITPTGGPSGYSTNGNIVSYADSVNGTWTMGTSGYDSLNRLVSASYTPVGTSTPQYWCWAYDSFGNRKVEATSSSALSGSACPTNGSGVSYHQYNAQNQIAGENPIQYDAAGNTTSDYSNSYLYDGYGRVCAVNNGLIMTQYIYDAEGARVAKGTISTWSCDTTANGFQTTASYVLGPKGEQVTEMEVSSGQQSWAHTNVNAGGMLLATYDPRGLHFQLTDWLGSRRVQTNAFGEVESTWRNLLYGNGQVGSSPPGAPASADDATEHHFTGQQRDNESGLDYFNARYYGSTIGRFTSPDPSGLGYAQQTDPQSFNLYGYVRNNPLRFVDPSGMETALYQDGNCFTYTYDSSTTDMEGVTYVTNHSTTFGDCSARGRSARANTMQASRSLINYLSKQIASRNINECQALANYVDAAQSIGNQGPISALKELTPNSHPFFESAQGIQTNGTMQTGFNAGPGSISGFRVSYQNDESDEPNGWNGDQSHHFAAYFQAGAAHPEASTVSPVPSLYEYGQSFSNPNIGDINLGYAAQELGQLYGLGAFSAADVGNRIRNNICQ